MSEEQGEAQSREQREAVREKAQQVRARQRRNRAILTLSFAVTGLAIFAVVAILIVNTVWPEANKPQAVPAHLDDDGVVIDAAAVTKLSSVGGGTLATPSATPTPEDSPTAASGPVEVRIYVDYLASNAAQFQKVNAKQLADWVRKGAVTVTYHPVALLTSRSAGSKYSLRAASAAGCVTNLAPESFFAFTHELLAQQPEENTEGLTNTQIADIAVAVGVDDPKAVRDCIEGEVYLKWAKAATERALAQPLPGTNQKLTASPTVLVNGTPYIGSWDDPEEFSQFVLEKSSKAYYKQTTPAPSPSAQ